MADDLNRKIVLVVRPTRLDELVARYNTVDQARFYVEHLGADFSDYLCEHQLYRAAMSEAEEILRDFGLVQRLDRRFLPNFLFGPEDGVVVLGQDGLVANTLKYLSGQRVIAVNPDPRRWDGVLLPFRVDDLGRIMRDERAGRRSTKLVTMAEAVLNTGERLLAVNDLFIGRRTHASARYQVRVGDREEVQSSSGVIVSTGLGSTGWLKSLYAGWSAATRMLLGPEAAPATPPAAPCFPWDADRLHWFVREPFPSKTSGTDLVVGWLAAKESLCLISQMPEDGVIFSDGIEADWLSFGSGAKVVVSLAEARGVLVT
ncbi:MAG: sugar kinase [Azospirillum sp.]|nr:sugar kinase [Azospirillum sp.]